jgi:hypothetical protein
MKYFDVKEIVFKLKKGGSTTASSYSGGFGFKRPQSEFEAQKMAIEFLAKKYPGYEVIDLKITYK